MDVLTNKARINSLNSAQLSNMRLHVYQMASHVLRIKASADQKTFIERQPIDIQPLLKKECRRLYDQRKRMPKMW